MSNSRDDRTSINFTVSDRLMIAEIHTHIQKAINVEKTVITNKTWIAALRWVVGGGFGIVALRLFGAF